MRLTDYPVLFPLDRRKTRFLLSSAYGMRYHPIREKRIFHKGIDLAVPEGEPVYSAGNGMVVRAGYSRSYGWFVCIRHTGGYATLYAHMSRIYVKTGTDVCIGRRIGDVGHSGMATGNHLHFELERNGRTVDPMRWFGMLKYRHH